MEILLILFGGIMPLFIAEHCKTKFQRAFVYYFSGFNMAVGVIVLIENTIKVLNGIN